MDDKIRDTLLNAYTQAHQSADPIVSKILERLKNTPLQMAQSAMDADNQVGGAVQGALQSAGQAGQNIYNYGNEAITNAGHILEKGGPITQAFGNYNPQIEKYSGGVNYGTDIGVPTGTKTSLPEGRWHILEANSDGSMNRGYGNSVYAQNLETGEKLRLSHLSKVGVQKGDIVSGGRIIGETGATGNATGPHEDIEYYTSGGQIADIMKSRYANSL